MGECWYCKLVKEGGICPRCDKAKIAEPELHNGFTIEQWQKIAELPVPIICEFWDVNVEDAVQRIMLGTNGTRFASKNGQNWKNCRVVNKPNYWQPWFGGECPVKEGCVVLTLTNLGVHSVGTARRFLWGGEEQPVAHIIAYMVLSQEEQS